MLRQRTSVLRLKAAHKAGQAAVHQRVLAHGPPLRHHRARAPLRLCRLAANRTCIGSMTGQLRYRSAPLRYRANARRVIELVVLSMTLHCVSLPAVHSHLPGPETSVDALQQHSCACVQVPLAVITQLPRVQHVCSA